MISAYSRNSKSDPPIVGLALASGIGRGVRGLGCEMESVDCGLL